MSRMMQFAVTDLPEPDSPTMAVTLPLGTSKPTSLSAWVVPMSVLKSTARSRISSTLSAIVRSSTRYCLGEGTSMLHEVPGVTALHGRRRRDDQGVTVPLK